MLGWGHFLVRTLQSGHVQGFGVPSHSQGHPSLQLGPHREVLGQGSGCCPLPFGMWSLAAARLAAFWAQPVLGKAERVEWDCYYLLSGETEAQSKYQDHIPCACNGERCQAVGVGGTGGCCSSAPCPTSAASLLTPELGTPGTQKSPRVTPGAWGTRGRDGRQQKGQG